MNAKQRNVGRRKPARSNSSPLLPQPERHTASETRIVNDRLWEAVRHEHEMLRTEVVQRMSLHNSLLTWASAVLVGIIGLGIIGAKEHPAIAEAALAILAPAVACAVVAAVHVYNAMIERAGDYLLWLERKAVLLLDVPHASPEWLSNRTAFARRYGVPPRAAVVLDWPWGWEHWIRARGTHYRGFYGFRNAPVVFLPVMSAAVAILHWITSPDSLYVSALTSVRVTRGWAVLLAIAAYLAVGFLYRWLIHALDRALGRDFSLGPLQLDWEDQNGDHGSSAHRAEVAEK